MIAHGKILDPTSGFSTTLNFPLPQHQRASALHASGVPIGTPREDSPYAEAGTFVPHVVVRNLLASPQNVTITIEYPGESGPEQMVLPPTAVGPNTTQDIALDSVMEELPLPLPYCSIRIQYSGPPGSAIAELSSIEEKGDLVVDSRLVNERDAVGSGAYPWHLDKDAESVLFLTNLSAEDARVGLRVQARGTAYLTDLKLRPRETRAIDIRKLRDEQKPDFQGNKIPADATDGSVLWGRADQMAVIGRLIVTQQGKGFASNYSCIPCPCGQSFVALDVGPSPSFDLLPGMTGNCTATETSQDCNGTLFYYNVTSFVSWSSSNTLVATVDNGTSKGLVTGIDGGASAIVAAYTAFTYTWDYTTQSCLTSDSPVSASSTCRTRVAKWAVLQSDSGMVNTANCPFTPGAMERNRVYAAYDDFGQVPFTQAWILNERLVSPTDCGAILGGTHSGPDFPDTISVCQTGCTLQTEQTFTINTRAVGAKDCSTCAVHTGWRVAASYNFSNVTPY